MYNRQLDTFLCVAEQGSFSKAAETLFISPSAVTQQMNNLENTLGVKLFIRTRHGVTLTEAGRYLRKEGIAIVRHNEEIHQNLQVLHQKGQKTIRIGTGLLQKCRLFYELWPQFDGAKKGYSVQSVEINPHTSDFCGADLIESLSDGSAWQTGLPFVKLLEIPLACAVPRSHPLAQKASPSGISPGMASMVSDKTINCSAKEGLTLNDLRGNVLVTIHRGKTKVLDDFITDARKAGIEVMEVKRYEYSVFTMCAINQYVMQTPMCWQDLHPDLVTIPCNWNYSLPYGFYVCNPSHRVVKEFLDFAKKMCQT